MVIYEQRSNDVLELVVRGGRDDRKQMAIFNVS